MAHAAADHALDSSSGPYPISTELIMKRLAALIGMSVGGWVGWEIGALASFFTAFIVSVVGTGVGLYMVNRFEKRYLP